MVWYGYLINVGKRLCYPEQSVSESVINEGGYRAARAAKKFNNEKIRIFDIGNFVNNLISPNIVVFEPISVISPTPIFRDSE